MNKYTEIYNVITRNDKVRFKSNIHFMAETDDHQAVVEWASKEFPAEYKKALEIVNNPDRKLLKIWEDDLEWFRNKYHAQCIESEDLSELIFDFINKNDISSKFYQFLNDNKDTYSCDVEFMMQDYK